jgi:hypothetical protein
MKDNAYELLYENSGRKLESIPFESRTPELCLNAMRWNTKEFRHVPDSLKTPEICLNALIQACSNRHYEFDEIVKYIPAHFRNFDSRKKK